MQADQVRKEARPFAEKLISLDPVDFDSAINQYFDANAKVRTTYCDLRGATTLKRMAQLMARLAVESELEKEPVYDDKDQAIHFTFDRTYKAPTLPSYIPLSGFVARQRQHIHWDCVVHLNAEEQAGKDRPTLVVSKLDMEMREKPYFYPLLPTHLLRPLFSLLALVVATSVGFFSRHSPKQEGPVELILNAVRDMLFGVYFFLLGKKEEATVRVGEIRDRAGNGVQPMLGNVVSSVTAVANDLQERAKQAGIPVEEYMAKAADVAKQLEDRAKTAGIPVEEYQAQVAKVIDETRKKGAEFVGSLQTQTKATADNVQSAAENHLPATSTDSDPQKASKPKPKPTIKAAKPTQDQHQQHNGEHHAHPGSHGHGGHTTQHHTHHESEIHARPKSHATGERDEEGRPTTPLGGHDPLAKEAFSYARAAAE